MLVTDLLDEWRCAKLSVLLYKVIGCTDKDQILGRYRRLLSGLTKRIAAIYLK